MADARTVYNEPVDSKDAEARRLSYYHSIRGANHARDRRVALLVKY
jgi:hypothetical protein